MQTPLSPCPAPQRGWRLGFRFACLLAWLFVTTSAHGEQTTCSARPSSSEWRFPSVVPWRASPPIHASVQVTCQHRGPLERKAAVCLSLGLGSGGKGFDRRQLTDNGTESGTALAIRILGPGSANFGSYYFQHSALSITMSIGPHAQATQTIPLQLSIVEDQVTAPARNAPYTSDFYPGHTAVAVVHTPAFGSPDCSDRQPDPVNTFSFKVSASIPHFCEFSGGIATMRFPDRRGKDDARRTAATHIWLRCTNGTPYRIQLKPSNGSARGQGEMRWAGRDPDSGDKVPYALFQDPDAILTPWGSEHDNSRAGIGSGQVQSIPVYGVLPARLDVTPGPYSDDVVVSVSY